METKIGKCKRCGKTTYLIPSNNPLHDGDICLDCINAAIDVENLEHFSFFCRTYNYPVNANLYIAMLNKNKATAIKDYVENLFSNNGLEYTSETTDKWKEVEKEWSKVKTHHQLLEKIKPLKEDFVERCGEKWGMEYNFEQYLKLENQFTAIIKNLNMTNPTQIDTVKKYCKMSLLVDDMISGGEVKAIADGTAALARLSNLAQIEELSESAVEGTIKTVADLYKYMEDHNYKFNYYDNVDRDIVDKTIKDIQESIRNEINSAVGLDVTLNQVKDNYYRSLEEDAGQKAIEETPIEDIIGIDDYSKENDEIDKELEQEDVYFEDEDDE